MTTLYRSPDVLIDAFEWHLLVYKRKGRINTAHRWRPLSNKPVKWRPMSAWQGTRPKGLGNRFWRYRCHVREALAVVEMRQEALGRLERVRPSGAMLRNSLKEAA